MVYTVGFATFIHLPSWLHSCWPGAAGHQPRRRGLWRSQWANKTQVAKEILGFYMVLCGFMMFYAIQHVRTILGNSHKVISEMFMIYSRNSHSPAKKDMFQ